MIIIGLTGGIATGKSTVSKMFQSQNIPIIDADMIAKQVVEIGKPAYEMIVEAFTEDVLMSTGHINRKKLANIVFNDDKNLKKLNSIVHPYVKRVFREEIKKYRALKEPYVVLDVPLLYESSFDKLCDMILVVFTDQDTQIKRLTKRDHITECDAIKRINAQMSLRDKVTMADFKIDNSLSILETRKQFDMFMKRLKEFEKPRKPKAVLSKTGK